MRDGKIAKVEDIDPSVTKQFRDELKTKVVKILLLINRKIIPKILIQRSQI